MTVEAKILRTPLFALQQARGGRFVPFAGWEMAVQFAGVVAEHMAVRSAVGLFDVSHMGEIVLEGPQAAAAVQHLITQDVSKLLDNRALYTVMCSEAGGIVDDLIVYREHPERFFLCVNASRCSDDFAHMQAHTKAFDCSVTDVSAAWAQVALQGPLAQTMISGICRHNSADMKPFSWVDTQVGGIDVRLARTGYTGEHGFELYCQSNDAEALFLALEKAGEPHKLGLCGLGARDTLRLEMKYPLYGNDIDLAHNPFEAGLGWVVKLQKGAFVGSKALQAIKAAPLARQWIGFKMMGRGIARPGYPITAEGRVIGSVTSGTHSPSLGEAIGCGYVPTRLAQPGMAFDIMIRDKPVPAQVVATPFYKSR